MRFMVVQEIFGHLQILQPLMKKPSSSSTSAALSGLFLGSTTFFTQHLEVGKTQQQGVLNLKGKDEDNHKNLGKGPRHPFLLFLF